MRRKTAWAVIVSLLLVMGTAASIFAFYGQSSQSVSAARRGTGYLLASYNPSVGLVSETPMGSTFFVYSDNFLAAYVLHGSDNATVRAIAANITSTDTRFLAMLPHPTNQYQVISSSNGSFFASRNYVISRQGSSVIETTLNNGTSPLSPARYADIAFLDALYFHQVGERAFAISDFNLGAKLYDGRGFNDAAFFGQYQTYKLALYSYVGKVLGAFLPPGVDGTLAKLQAPDGGFFTGYGRDLSPKGTTNTETTSLAVMALSATSTYHPKAPNAAYLPIAVAAVAALVLLEVLAVRRWSKRREKAAESAVRFS